MNIRKISLSDHRQNAEILDIIICRFEIGGSFREACLDMEKSLKFIQEKYGDSLEGNKKWVVLGNIIELLIGRGGSFIDDIKTIRELLEKSGMILTVHGEFIADVSVQNLLDLDKAKVIFKSIESTYRGWN